MVKVRVAQDDGVNRLRREGKRVGVAHFVVPPPLNETAIKQHEAAVGTQQVTRPGDVSRRPVKLKLHGGC